LKLLTTPAKRALVESARKLLASKSKREAGRLVGQRKVKRNRHRGPLMRAPRNRQPWEEELLGKEPGPVVAQRTGRTLSYIQKHRSDLRIVTIHPKLWTKEEMSLFGTMTDGEIARRTGRKVGSVYAKRRQSGFGPCNSKWKPWTENEKALLGKMPDTEVARLTGHPVESVRRTRYLLRIPYVNPRNIPWTSEEDALLGQLSDREVARITGHTFKAVRNRRTARGLRDPSVRGDWTPEEDRWLGTASDEEVAKRLNRTLGAAKSRRNIKKIPVWKPVRGS
jgi:hypothetical protein